MALRPNTSAIASTPNPRVVPAQVNFLTIYNPTFGDSEDTEKEQIVFWAGKDELGTSRPGRKASKSPDRHAETQESSTERKKLTEAQTTNERLRRVGLARGMVEFARNFANDQLLDTIETDRSRIVLHELEKDWWILASIDLTRLPATASQSKSHGDSSKEPQMQIEYSAREVSPAMLLRTQLIKAHNLFLLHHSANLWELYNRLGRSYFCATLNRYWEKFARDWDVLLHGNPATDVYGDCVKLVGGGELGVGVGEEEWGSGEREVLEGFIARTEGCVECVVGRYGAAPPEKEKRGGEGQKKRRKSIEEKLKLGEDLSKPPWLGTGEDPGPADGVLFSGVGTVSRKSLATVSQWMEAIFRHGDSAYGIGENPASRPRTRRKRPNVQRRISDDPAAQSPNEEAQGAEVHPRLRSPRNKAPDLRRKAIENNAAPPGIPAPLVGAVERSLDKALAKAAAQSDSRSPSPRSKRQLSPKSSPQTSPGQEKTQAEAMKGSLEPREESPPVFSMEGMKNMLSFGYGSSWTLNPSGFDKKEDKVDKNKPNPKALQPPPGDQRPETRQTTQTLVSDNRPAEERLQELDPTPQVSDEDSPFVQKLESSIGKFLIGLSGDLENTEFEESDESGGSEANGRRSAPQRIFLRTLTVELAHAHNHRPTLRSMDRKASQVSQASAITETSTSSVGTVGSSYVPEPKTSAAASVDGANPTTRHEKVQVAVYVHQPFIFVFLFELHTSSLTIPAFYRSIHHQLGPLQKPLLQRTDPSKSSARVAAVLNEKAGAAVSAAQKHVDKDGNAIYDIVYDPTKTTIRTSIPNIPVPTSPESVIKTTSTVSGAWYTLGIPIGTSTSPSTSRLDPHNAKSKSEPWTRIEALNVHTQILNTFCATRNPLELERTVKTSRGWWVLWMKVSPAGKESEELKEAFLVRKSTDYTSARSGKEGHHRATSGSSNPAGRWLLRDQSREVSSGSNFNGSTGLTGGAKGVSEGVGIDARKWVEGLLTLTQ